MFPGVKSLSQSLSTLWTGVDPVEAEQAATAAALERRRAWTKDYSGRVYVVWDLIRKLRIARKITKHDGVSDEWEQKMWPEENWDLALTDEEGAAVLRGLLGVESGSLEARDARRLERRLRNHRKDVESRYPGLLMPTSTMAFIDEAPELESSDGSQMVKDLARETVVVCGEARSPNRSTSSPNAHYETVHNLIIQTLLDAGTATETAVALATAAMVAAWRTRVGADAWEKAASINNDLKLRRGDICPLYDETSFEEHHHIPPHASDYALVSRPTEPLTTIVAGKDRVVVTAHSHFSEVRVVEPDEKIHWGETDPSYQDDPSSSSPSTAKKRNNGLNQHASSPNQTQNQKNGSTSARCGDERAFFALTARTTLAAYKETSNDANLPDMNNISNKHLNSASSSGFKLTRIRSLPRAPVVARRCVLAVVLVADDSSPPPLSQSDDTQQENTIKSKHQERSSPDENPKSRASSSSNGTSTSSASYTNMLSSYLGGGSNNSKGGEIAAAAGAKKNNASGGEIHQK